jgi:hypothetical protein
MKIYAEISRFSGQLAGGMLIPGASTPGTDGGTGRRRT